MEENPQKSGNKRVRGKSVEKGSPMAGNSGQKHQKTAPKYPPNREKKTPEPSKKKHFFPRSRKSKKKHPRVVRLRGMQGLMVRTLEMFSERLGGTWDLRKSKKKTPLPLI